MPPRNGSRIVQGEKPPSGSCAVTQKFHACGRVMCPSSSGRGGYCPHFRLLYREPRLAAVVCITSSAYISKVSLEMYVPRHVRRVIATSQQRPRDTGRRLLPHR